ncbi:hypothetical protein MBLNU457_g0121t1 [Dothideomycetes sp. NU457]
MQAIRKMAFPQVNHCMILGGSLAGLMHAHTVLTHSPSTKVTILERSPTALLHNQGAGVVAGSETQQFFEQYVHPGRDIAVTSQQRLYLDKQGGIVNGSVDKRQQRMTSWDLLYRFLRWRVDGMGIDEYFTKTPPDNGGSTAKYLNGSTVSKLEDLGPSEGVRVTWKDKSGQSQSADVDLVIAADGGSSTTRRQLKPSVERTYVGYVAFRGTVPETELSEAADEVFSEHFAFYHTQGIQILAYLIPGENGSLEKGHRLMNWVWYVNLEEGSAELEDLMTDNDGKRHAITLPPGGMKESAWQKYVKMADDVLPPQYAELVNKTRQPFVQAITDNISDENSFFDGKVLLVGDALAGFRPHTAASTGQAAYDALTLGEWMQGKISRDEYRERCLSFAKDVQRHGVMLGERSQFGRHPFAS